MGYDQWLEQPYQDECEKQEAFEEFYDPIGGSIEDLFYNLWDSHSAMDFEACKKTIIEYIESEISSLKESKMEAEK